MYDINLLLSSSWSDNFRQQMTFCTGGCITTVKVLKQYLSSWSNMLMLFLYTVTKTEHD
jgi:hypothetical protein